MIKPPARRWPEKAPAPMTGALARHLRRRCQRRASTVGGQAAGSSRAAGHATPKSSSLAVGGSSPRSRPRRSPGCGRRASGPPRARARRAGSRGPASRSRDAAGGARTRSRRRRGRAWAARRSAPAGCRAISRAMTTFCWLPPDSERGARVGVAAADVELGDEPRGGLGHAARRQQARTASRVAVVAQRRGSPRASKSSTRPRRWRSSAMCPTPASGVARARRR